MPTTIKTATLIAIGMIVSLSACAPEQPAATVQTDEIRLISQATAASCEGGWRTFKTNAGGTHENTGTYVRNLQVTFGGDHLSYQQGNAGETPGQFKGTIQTAPDPMVVDAAVSFFRNYRFVKAEWNERIARALNAPEIMVTATNQARPRTDVYLRHDTGFFAAVFLD